MTQERRALAEQFLHSLELEMAEAQEELYADVADYWIKIPASSVSSINLEPLFPCFWRYAERLFDASASKLLEDAFSSCSHYLQVLGDIALVIIDHINPFSVKRLSDKSRLDVALCSLDPQGEWERCIRWTIDAQALSPAFRDKLFYALRQKRASSEFEVRLKSVLKGRAVHWKAEFLRTRTKLSNTPPPASVVNTSNEELKNRRATVDAYINEVLKTTGKVITRTDIWRNAGYKSRAEFERWESHWYEKQGRKPNKTANRRFTRILIEKPHLK